MSSPLFPGTPHFLLVEADPLVGAGYRLELRRHGLVTVTQTVAGALLVVASAPLAGIVADVTLPDGPGLAVAAEARARAHDLPVLIISDDVSRERLDAVHEFGASYLVKPIEARQLARFAVRAVARHRRFAMLLEKWIDRYALTAAESVALRMALDGLGRDQIAVRRGITGGSAKSLIHRLLARTGHASLADLRADFYREGAG